MDPREEAHLGPVHVPRSRHDPLIDQGDADLGIGHRPETSESFVRIPIAAEHVGTEVREPHGLHRRTEDLEEAQTMPDRETIIGGEDRPHLVSRASPRFAVAIHTPAALHAQVRMDGQVRVGPDEEVLAPGRRLANDLTGEVDGREPRHAKIGSDELVTGQRGVESRGGDEHGVAFGHGSRRASSEPAPTLAVPEDPAGRSGA